MVESIPDDVGEYIIEIGPGHGILTNELLFHGYKVKAIEVDNDLIGPLEERFKDNIRKNLFLLNQDCIDFIKDFEGPIPYIISNLPYNISTELIGILLDRIQFGLKNMMVSGGTIMFQKEFGERLTAKHGSKKYGRISIYFQMKMEYNKLFHVSRSLFDPIPKVDSIVINFRQRQKDIIDMKNEKMFRKVVDVSFMNRRKMLKNILSPKSLGIEMKDMEFMSILEEHGWYYCRPEDLSPRDFMNMADLISCPQR